MSILHFTQSLLSRVIHCEEAYGGFLTTQLAAKIDKMFKKARKWSLNP